MLFISSKNIFERLTPFVKSILNNLNISFNDSIEHVKKKKTEEVLVMSFADLHFQTTTKTSWV